MKRVDLKKRLAEQIAEYSTWPYERFQGLTETISKDYGVPETESFYQVAVYVLEEEPDYIQVAISVDDGGKFGLIVPVGASFIVRREPGESPGSGLAKRA